MTITGPGYDAWKLRGPPEALMVECPGCGEEVAIGSRCECGDRWAEDYEKPEQEYERDDAD